MDIEVDGRNQKEFAQVLVEGKLKLYLVNLKKDIYLLEDSSIIQLTDENFEEIIKIFAGSCIVSNDNKLFVKPNIGSLIRFVQSINEGKCYGQPSSIFGILLGYNWTKANLFRSSFLENSLGDFNSKNSIIKIGLFFDIPLWQVNNLSLVGLLTYDKYKYSHDGQIRFEAQLGNPFFGNPTGIIIINQHVDFDFSFLGLELTPKYSYKIKQVAPFAMIGLASSVLLDQKSLLIKESDQSGSVSTMEKTDIITLKNIQFGYTLGFGLQYFYKPRNYISLEFKNSKLFNNQMSRKILAINNKYITLKFNL